VTLRFNPSSLTPHTRGFTVAGSQVLPFTTHLISFPRPTASFQGSTYAVSASLWGGGQFYTVAAHRSVNGVGCYLRGDCEGDMLAMTRHI
jgi:hypothetical protein